MASARFTTKGVVIVAILSMAVLLPSVAQAGSLNYPNFSSTSGLQLNGSAVASSGDLILTSANPSEVGSAFTNKKVLDPTRSFKTHFETTADSGGGLPADGMTFTIQNDTRGASAIGDAGGGLGYGSTGGPNPAITPSIAVGYNLYDNAGINLFKNGDASAPVVHADYNAYQDLFSWVTYSARRHVLKVFVNTTDTRPKSPLLRKKINLAKVLGGRSRVGFTAATGGLDAQQYVKEWDLSN